MTRKALNLNNLLRGRVRASMNKYNLFNLYKKQLPRFTNKTLYQQKWYGKMNTRGYHGEHLTERRWARMFDPKLEAVAQLDASLKGEEIPPTPLTLQTYATLEKRLEFAVFRALFASSIRQARQYILTGNVKVNGTTIKHPSFNLKPGDIFSVTPERILQAMGRDKPSLAEAVKVDYLQVASWNRYVKAAKSNPKEVWEVKQTKPKSLNTLLENTAQNSVSKYNDSLLEEMKKMQKEVTRESLLVDIVRAGQSASNEAKNDEGGKSDGKTDTASELESKKNMNDTKAKKEDNKDEFSTIYQKIAGPKNAFKCSQVFKLLQDAKSPLLESISINNATEFVTKKSDESNASEHKLAAKVKVILSELQKSQVEAIRVRKSNEMLDGRSIKSMAFDPKFVENLKPHPFIKKEEILQDESKAFVRLPWQKGLFGRQDVTKPYFTPWTPRPFIGCFSILPHHIEIDFETGHAVYLRDPVARPDHSEVITPFSEDVHKRAYMYYVRKGM